MFVANWNDAWNKCIDTSGSDPAIRINDVGTKGSAVGGTLTMGQLNDVAAKLFLDNGDGTFSLNIQ